MYKRQYIYRAIFYFKFIFHRGRYTKYLREYTPSGSGTVNKKPYYLAEFMVFLEPFTKSRQTKSNVSQPNDERVSEEILHETASFTDEDPPQIQMERQSVAPLHQEEKE